MYAIYRGGTRKKKTLRAILRLRDQRLERETQDIYGPMFSLMFNRKIVFLAKSGCAIRLLSLVSL